MFIRRLFFILLLAIPTSGFAFDANGIGESVVEGWSSWMRKHNVPAGALVVAYEGEVVATGEINRSVDDPAKVASLSKAITAICTLKAAEANGAAYNSPLSEVIPAAMAAHPPRDDRFGEITIGQLINHTSGLQSRYHANEIEKLRTFAKENKLWQFSKFSQERLVEAPGSASYHYNNSNYLALGLVIEELTGEGYVEYCKREVLDPAGVTTAQLDEYWTVMSSWGGWKISAHDYLRFALYYFGPDAVIGQPAGTFLPASDIGRGRSYGAGMSYRRTGMGAIQWHRGSWRWNGRIRDNFGAYMILYDNGFSVSVNYAHDAWENEIFGELDQILWDAVKN